MILPEIIQHVRQNLNVLWAAGGSVNPLVVGFLVGALVGGALVDAKYLG